MGKKRPKPGTSGGVDPSPPGIDWKASSASCVDPKVEEGSASAGDVSSDNWYVFKDPNYASKWVSGSSKRPRVWKSLKQVVSAERSLPGSVGYSAMEAPLSLKPTKKYSDVTGLPAKYTDPQTKLRYANVEEYAMLRLLSPDQVNGYLILRRASLPVT